jgi:hypothetical protein
LFSRSGSYSTSFSHIHTQKIRTYTLMRNINDFGRYPLIMKPYQVESLTNFRVCGVELTFPAPSQFGHRFLKPPSPIAPEPWHTEQVTSQSSARSYNRLGIKFTLFMRPLYMCKINCVFTFSIAFSSTKSIRWSDIMFACFRLVLRDSHLVSRLCL